jgi:hypothetical protein
MSIPSSDIYRHVRQQKYILVSMCNDKPHLWNTAWGKLVHLTEEDVRTQGLDIILRDLQEFSSRDSDVGAEVNGLGPEAKRARRLLRECWQVGITLRPGPKLELQAMMDTGKDRGIGKPEDRVTLPLPSSPEEFFRTLSEVFERCCVVENT